MKQQKQQVQRFCGARGQETWCKKRLEDSTDLNMNADLQGMMRAFKGGGEEGHGQTCLLKRPCSF